MLLVVLLSLSLTLASSSILGNWNWDWVNMYQNLSYAQRICYPDSFSITGNASAGYNITYDYTTNQNRSICQDPLNQSNQSIIQLSLTQDTNTGNWVDSYNYSLTYFDSNDTIFWFCTNTSSPLCEIINLFDRNGSFISQGFVQTSGCGVYLNPVPVDVSDPTACNPAINVTDSCISPPFSPGHTVYFTFADGSTVSESMNCIASPYLQIYWFSSDTYDQLDSIQNANMTYYYNYTAGQTSMHFSYSVPNETCIYSYQKLNGPLLSGIWYGDWQNTFDGGDLMNITSVDNLYMYLTSRSLGNVPFYQIQTDLFTITYNEVPYQYDPVSDTFTQLYADAGALYSRNGSVFNRTALMGNWSNPQFANSAAQAIGCCTPYTMSISNSTEGYLSTINIQVYLADDMAENDWCVNNSIYSGYQVVLETRYPSAYNMYWEFDSEPEKDLGYAVNMTNSNYSEIIVTLIGKPQLDYPYGQNCSFTLTPGNDPNPPKPPLSSSWLSVSMIPFMFAFAVVFTLI